MRLLLFLSLCGLTLPAQVVTSIQPAAVSTAPSGFNASETAGKAKSLVSVPTLGFLIDPAGAGLIPIRGIASAPFVGETIPKPNDVSQIYLPPREHYALVERSSPEVIAIWHLARPHVAAGKDVLDVIPHALAHPDSVTFSPRGTAAVLYSSARAQLQIIAGLPSKPAIQGTLSTGSLVQPATFAVSDDGRVVLAITGNGQIEISSDAKAWQPTALTYLPLALSFVPNTHNVMLSDLQQKQLILLRQIEVLNSAPVVLGDGLQPDHLAVTTDGETLIALDTAHQKLWEIDPKAFTVTSVAIDQQAQMLLTLRDGHTFLLSDAPFSVLKIASDSQSPAIRYGRSGTNR